jgi:hypothetical protein
MATSDLSFRNAEAWPPLPIAARTGSRRCRPGESSAQSLTARYHDRWFRDDASPLLHSGWTPTLPARACLVPAAGIQQRRGLVWVAPGHRRGVGAPHGVISAGAWPASFTAEFKD